MSDDQREFRELEPDEQKSVVLVAVYRVIAPFFPGSKLESWTPKWNAEYDAIDLFHRDHDEPFKVPLYDLDDELTVAEVREAIMKSCREEIARLGAPTT